mmetsp:Transcript_10483/g.11918  ORF Transcript_10483/g.11918 Transcript_10483/m.11918 type:complete len:90 (-) Transcript_10483:84-353(-)
MFAMSQIVIIMWKTQQQRMHIIYFIIMASILSYIVLSLYYITHRDGEGNELIRMITDAATRVLLIRIECIGSAYHKKSEDNDDFNLTGQ